MVGALQKRRAAGFSLVELLLVLVIVSVIGAIALPRFAQANARQQLQAAADRVASDLYTARARARAASETVTLTFDTATSSYTFNAVGGAADTVKLTEPPYGVYLKTAAFGANSHVASFNGFGVPAASGYVSLSNGIDTVTVQLRDNGEVAQ